MKIEAMVDWSPEEKAAKEKEWTQSLFTLRLQKATGQLENPMKIKQLRKDIARLKTAQHMGAAEAAAAAAHEVAAPAHDGGVRRDRFFEGEEAAGSAEVEGPRRGVGQGREEARGCSEGHREEDGRSRARPIHLLRNPLRPVRQEDRAPKAKSAPEEKQEEVVGNRKQ